MSKPTKSVTTIGFISQSASGNGKFTYKERSASSCLHLGKLGRLILIGVLCMALEFERILPNTAAQRSGGGHYNILSENRENKYCNEAGDTCMFSNQCCFGFSCIFDENYEGTCVPNSLQMEAANDEPIDNDGHQECFSNLDCNADQCCKRLAVGRVVQTMVCSNNCRTMSRDEMGIARASPSMGNYQGFNFWRRWQRSMTQRNKRTVHR